MVHGKTTCSEGLSFHGFDKQQVEASNVCQQNRDGLEKRRKRKHYQEKVSEKDWNAR